MTTRGFFTLAQNNGSIDYVKMSYALALSLKLTQRETHNLSIGITPGHEVPDRYRWAFDQIIEIPWSDLSSLLRHKIANEWKAIHMSPYRETIKLDSDMLFTRDISSWWELMSTQDMWICNSVLDQDHNDVQPDMQRKLFSDGNLPDVRTALMFFKKTRSTYETFRMCEQLFKNWRILGRECLGKRHAHAGITTDLVMSLSLKLTDLTQEWHVRNMVPTFLQCSEPVDLSAGNALQCNGVELSLPVHHHCDSLLVDRFIAAHEARLMAD